MQNILFDKDNNLKLIDFGLGNFTKVDLFRFTFSGAADRSRDTFCGTPAYAAPEMVVTLVVKTSYVVD